MAAFIYHVNSNDKSIFYKTKYTNISEEECLVFQTERIRTKNVASNESKCEYNLEKLTCMKLADFAVINLLDFPDLKQCITEEIINTTVSEIVAKAHNPRIEDFKETLLRLESLFGESPTSPFHIFDKFNETQNLLFNRTVLGFQGNKDIKECKNYEHLATMRIESILETSDGFINNPAPTIIIVTYLIPVLFYAFNYKKLL